ncbi:phosphotyrosine protein phosphatase [Sphingomonas lacunae]|uniref:protein-tyrosine-phosphatase n=2 Tax=Sphingomonas lacunae TaxID=2698828 RepID=A0A6M4B186_9SPHN|nr:phosphotyrosine protein phosphatase [Sphingomonas lacunae]
MNTENWLDRPAIISRFGSFRGMIRLAISYAQLAMVARPDLARVERLVFVCRGNICRSAFAHALAASLGFPVASFGLRTATGRPAHDPVIAEAKRRGFDLASHSALAVEEFEPAPGDLYLVMEYRQIGELRALAPFASTPVDLLGRYGGRPHLHDPYGLGAAFTTTSLGDIDRSVRALIGAIGAARIRR